MNKLTKALKIIVLMIGLSGFVMSILLIYPALRSERVVFEIQEINPFFYILKGISQGENYLFERIEIRINEPANTIKRVTFQYGELGLIQPVSRTPHSYVISKDNLSIAFESQKPFSFLFEFGKKIKQPNFSKCVAIESGSAKPITCKIAQKWYENFSNTTKFLFSVFLSAIIGFFLALLVYFLVNRYTNKKTVLQRRKEEI